MPLNAGERLGSYEILSPLGAGGMGEVYRARDSKLGREVAIKVLPEEFTEHPQKLARFEREAKLLAALNHPGIATLYGVEEFETKPFLVMELVEGETLGERISHGPIPVGEALTIAQQIAEALEAAHEKSVIHRDLKPANIKVDPEGKVKVLDFGLAKAFAEEVPESELSQSPTLSRDATRAGVILGTAAYMSPEQAKGKTVDKRTDIFSFGIVLFEMLAGKRAFSGEDASDVLAAILRMEPNWKALPRELDPRIQDLLRRCLTKDRKERLRDIGDVRIEIKEALAQPYSVVPSEGSKSSAPIVWRALTALFAVAFLATLWLMWSAENAPESSVRLSIDLGAGEVQLYRGPGAMVTFSSDGKMLAFVGRSADGETKLYLRLLDSLEATPLSGTENASVPFFSPDGRWLAFFQSGSLKKISVSGGAALTIVTDVPNGRGGAWGPDDTIVYARAASGLYRIPAAGGTPVELTTLGEQEVGHRWPWFLPHGKAVLFLVQAQGESFSEATIEAVFLETGERKILHQGGAYPRYAASGHLLFARESTLFAMPFDADRLEPTGEPSPVVEGIPVSPGGTALFATADDGALVYAPGAGGGIQGKLAWVDRRSGEEQLLGETGIFLNPELSADGRRLAVAQVDPVSGNMDIWTIDLQRNVPTRFTFDEANDLSAVWSPNGRRIVFNSNRAGAYQLYQRSASGSGTVELLLSCDVTCGPLDWSLDGDFLVYFKAAPIRDLWLLPMLDEGEPRLFLEDGFVKDQAKLSPDGRWIAYISDASGRFEVYVADFPEAAGKWQISTGGGVQPRWSGDGTELFYIAPDLAMTAVTIRAHERELEVGAPAALFDTRIAGGAVYVAGRRAQYDVAPDSRFLILQDEGSSGPAQTDVVLVLNWFEELKRLVPTD